MFANQRNIGFCETLERLHTQMVTVTMKMGHMDDRWGPDSDENEQGIEIVVESVDNTVLFTHNVSPVNFGASNASGAGNISGVSLTVCCCEIN